ncbi:MAG: hypothetical protein ACYS8I_16050 [Planctomycetota bacterium]
MMKKATYIFLTIVLTFAYAEARPPFRGTIFVNRSIITPEDPTAFKSLTAAGRGQRRMFDRRTNKSNKVNARLFTAEFDDGQKMEVRVNPEFDEKEAFAQAKKYSLVIGQMPFALRKDVESVVIHAGKKPFGGGNKGLVIHTGQGESYIRGGILAETLCHEASHTSLDRPHARNKDWLAAQKEDGKFISNYLELRQTLSLARRCGRDLLAVFRISLQTAQNRQETQRDIGKDHSQSHRVFRRSEAQYASSGETQGAGRRCRRQTQAQSQGGRPEAEDQQEKLGTPTYLR